MKTSRLDRAFDEGKEDIVEHLDFSKAKRINNHQKRVNVDSPIWMIDSLDREANRIGVTMQSIIKLWISEKLEVAKRSSEGK